MFNEQQQQVIEETQRNILLMATAGTGKTTTIAGRIRYILQQKKAVPAEILCITFTNRGCQEMNEKINGEAPLKNKVQVRTIHSFCYDVIRREYYMKYGKMADFVIFDEEDTKELLEELPNNGLDLLLLQNFIQMVKHERCRQENFSADPLLDYKRTIQKIFLSDPGRIDRLYNRKNKLFPESWKSYLKESGAELIACYDEALKKQNGLDFDALILRVFRLFKKKRIRRRWQTKYRYLIIDEVQDTSFFEYQILSALFKDNHILLAGDFFQTIYAWRGSEPFLILADYKKKYHPRLFSFAENYRSSQWLLEASFSCLQNLFGRQQVEEFYQQALQSHIRSEERKKIPYREFLLPEQEARAIFSDIRQLQQEKPELSIAVLTRNNMYNQYLSEYFHLCNEELPPAEKLPFMLVEQFKFFRRQEIKDLLAALKILLRPADQSSLKRYLTRYAAGIGRQSVARIEAASRNGCGLLLSDYLEPVIQKSGKDPFEPLFAAWESGNIVIFDVETTGLSFSEDEIIQLAAVRLGPQGQEQEAFVRFLRPDKPVGESEAVHGFSDDFLQAEGEAAPIVLRDFADFAAGAVISGHNVGFDIAMLKAQAGRQHVVFPDFAAQVWDTLDLCRRFYPGLPGYRLAALAERFSLPARKAHDALEDVRMTADLFSCLIRGRILATKTERQNLLQRYLPIFRETAAKLASLRQQMQQLSLCELVTKVVVDLGMKDFYLRHQQSDRVWYLRDFYLLVKNMEIDAENTEAALQELLKRAALSTSEMDRWLDQKRRIPVLTIHQAKGTEFDCVFLAGLSEGIFPSQQAVENGDMEEEKRLFYVAITRAKKMLYLSRSCKYKGRVLEESFLVRALPADTLETIQETALF